MMKKLMRTLSMLLLVVGFVGCPVTEQLLKTRLQGEWECVQVDEEDFKITLTFDGDQISKRMLWSSLNVDQTSNGTFEVKDSLPSKIALPSRYNGKI